ncbi:hypothetical protein C8R45DRAFT_955729 [Mycena sanguinolenta]|nr:hypothetical protein C8R45DRAFT_955729 [Mycena sanguinolenta]
MLQLPQPGYPILTLPNEIMSEIFLFSSLPSIIGGESTPNPRYAPMLLLHVCRAWRVIAIATPRLWANLWLDSDDLAPRFFEAENFDKFLAEHVERLGACPLSLRLTGGYDESDEFTDEGECLLANIFDRLSSRVEVLDIVTEIAYYREHRPPHFPLLRKLTVGFPYADESDLIGLGERPIQTFSAAPRLQELYLFQHAIPSHFAIPWETLTVFAGEELLSRDCVEVLRLAPSLTKCTFESEINVPADFPTLTHQNIKSLKFTNGAEALVRFVTFPALQDLEVYADDMASIQLLQFISQSSSTLLRLSAADVSLQSLRNMSILTHLQLCSPDTAYLSCFLSMLDRTRNPSVLPQLQMLEFEDCVPFVNVYLTDVLSSRAVDHDGVAKLRSFRQIWPRSQFHALRVDYTAYIACVFERLIEDGMEIFIGRPTSIKHLCWGI